MMQNLDDMLSAAQLESDSQKTTNQNLNQTQKETIMSPLRDPEPDIDLSPPGLDNDQAMAGNVAAPPTQKVTISPVVVTVNKDGNSGNKVDTSTSSTDPVNYLKAMSKAKPILIQNGKLHYKDQA